MSNGKRSSPEECALGTGICMYAQVNLPATSKLLDPFMLSMKHRGPKEHCTCGAWTEHEWR